MAAAERNRSRSSHSLRGDVRLVNVNLKRPLGSKHTPLRRCACPDHGETELRARRQTNPARPAQACIHVADKVRKPGTGFQPRDRQGNTARHCHCHSHYRCPASAEVFSRSLFWSWVWWCEGFLLWPFLDSLAGQILLGHALTQQPSGCTSLVEGIHL